MLKNFPVSRKKSMILILFNQSALLTTSNPNNLSACAFKHAKLCSTSSWVIIGLSASGFGSPIKPVPPPTKRIGWCPAFFNLVEIKKLEKWPICKESPVGSVPI